MDTELKQQIELMIQKANETLEDAKVLFDLGRYGVSASRAYYAVFHIVQAILLAKGLSFSKHSGVIGGFSKYFIKEGTFPTEYAAKINKLWKKREIGDYEYENKIGEIEAKVSIEDAIEILSSVNNYLEKLIQ